MRNTLYLFILSGLLAACNGEPGGCNPWPGYCRGLCHFSRLAHVRMRSCKNVW